MIIINLMNFLIANLKKVRCKTTNSWSLAQHLQFWKLKYEYDTVETSEKTDRIYLI